MRSLLLEGGNGGTGSYLLYGGLFVVLIVMLVLPFFTNRKKNREFQNMLSAIKVGDMVRTAGGIIGKITKIIDKGEIKTVILETGSKTEKSYMEFDISMIYCVLKSSKVETEAKADKAEEKPETAEETVEAEAKTEAAEEKPAKKTRAKSAVKKKTK